MSFDSQNRSWDDAGGARRGRAASDPVHGSARRSNRAVTLVCLLLGPGVSYYRFWSSTLLRDNRAARAAEDEGDIKPEDVARVGCGVRAVRVRVVDERDGDQSAPRPRSAGPHPAACRGCPDSRAPSLSSSSRAVPLLSTCLCPSSHHRTGGSSQVVDRRMTCARACGAATAPST